MTERASPGRAEILAAAARAFAEHGYHGMSMRDLAKLTKRSPATLYNYVSDMPTLLHAADCVISKAGGLIVTESLACGLPLLLMQVIPGQETGNAALVTREGAGALVTDPLLLLETLADWLAGDGRLYRECVANARRLGRPQAAYDAADLIWEVCRRPVPDHSRRFPISRAKLKALLQSFGDSMSPADRPPA